MTNEWALWLTLYIASGALIGGVVTPLLAANKRLNDWAAMLLGAAVGAVTHVFGLVVLWIILAQRPTVTDHRPAWQRDAITLEEALAAAGPSVPARERLALAGGSLRRNWWPAPRREGHSHRMTYVGVFVALAVLTAIEVIISFADLGFSPVGPLVMLSTLKVVLVALFFMHLIYDSKWYALMFVSALPFSVLIIIVLALA